jgi:bis(5'-nucleosyl)-tetraphosphatase (symmetrical)
MAVYAIGDVQGCYDSLRRLVDKIGFKPKRDELWFVGDLVNRGPKSAKVLRYVRGLGDSATCVLGNHDLHLLATYAGARKLKRTDTIADVLDAKDADELIDWLRKRPLLRATKKYMLVHAGLHPRWSIRQARALTREVEERLRHKRWTKYLEEIYEAELPSQWDDRLKGPERLACILAFTTRMRALGQDLEFDDYAGTLDNVPKEASAWFQLDAKKRNGTCVVFGHWAALGLHMRKRHIGLDTGCVWGGELTAVRLKDRKIYSQKAVES